MAVFCAASTCRCNYAKIEVCFLTTPPPTSAKPICCGCIIALQPLSDCAALFVGVSHRAARLRLGRFCFSMSTTKTCIWRGPRARRKATFSSRDYFTTENLSDNNAPLIFQCVDRLHRLTIKNHHASCRDDLPCFTPDFRCVRVEMVSRFMRAMDFFAARAFNCCRIGRFRRGARVGCKNSCRKYLRAFISWIVPLKLLR